MIVERNPLTQSVRAPPVLPLPESVAEHRRSRAASLVVGCGEGPADQGMQAQCVKKLAGREIALRIPRLPTRRQIETPAAVGEDSREHVLSIAKLLPNRVGE